MPTDSRNQRSWATRIDRRVDARPGSARATRATRCRGGWSARRAAAGRASRRARGRARRGSARRRRSSPSGRSSSSSPKPRPRSAASIAVAPAIAAGVLEPRLGVGVGGERRLVGVAVGHPRLERARARASISRDPVEARRSTYSRSVASARGGRWSCSATRTPLPSAIVPGVEPGLAGEHPQQGRLAAAVAAGERHPLAAVELERDVGEQRPPADVLGQPGGRDDGHRCAPAG